MATPQERFDQLYANQPKPAKPIQDGLGFAEKELLDFQQRRQNQINPPPKEESTVTVEEIQEDSPVSAKASTTSKATIRPHSQSPSVNQLTHQEGHLAGMNPDAVVFVPHGIWRGGLSATKVDATDGFDVKEPTFDNGVLVGQFCVWSLVLKFPYKYLQDPGSKISERFFAREQVYQRGWKLHYIHGNQGGKPLLLVPEGQVKRLVKDINREFNAKVDVPAYPFQLSFYDDGTPSPQLLGTFNSKDEMLSLQTTIPDAPLDHGKVPANASEFLKQAFGVWQDKVQAGLDADKKRNKGTARKKKQEVRRQLTVIETLDQLKRAQRYLGLRQKPPATQFATAGEAPTSNQPESFDSSKPAPFDFEDETIIISIDVEAYERDHNVITEVGVSTLDTTSLRNLAPGEQGGQWVKQIRSRHFRIKGHDHLRNTDFVQGNPDMFQFGTSEFVPPNEIADAVDSCFEQPYSIGFECNGPPDSEDQIMPNECVPCASTHDTGSDKAQPRNLLLLGHDIDHDVTYLSQLGSSIFGSGVKLSTADPSVSRWQRVLSSIRERLDTAILYKALTKSEQAKGLSKICHELDIIPWHAHNAGNDARYTMEAFVKMVVKARQEDDNAIASGAVDADKTTYEIERERKIQDQINAARRVIEADLAAYENGDATATDGGAVKSFFQKANGATDTTGDAITYEDAERRYMARASAPLSGDVEAQFDESWKAPGANTQAAEEDEDYPY